MSVVQDCWYLVNIILGKYSVFIYISTNSFCSVTFDKNGIIHQKYISETALERKAKKVCQNGKMWGYVGTLCLAKRKKVVILCVYEKPAVSYKKFKVTM